MISYKYSFCIYVCSFVLPSSCDLKDFITSVIDITEHSPDYQSKINMVLFKGSSGKVNETYKVPLSQITSLKQYLNFKLPVVIYIHGYIEHYSNESVQMIIQAYLQKEQDNLIVLDWSEFSFENYALLAKRVKTISMHTAKAIESLAKVGMNIDTLHIVGHSLGGQLAGFLGRFLTFVIPKITALDPANPLFYEFNAEHINNSSARQVDVIHTDSGMYGALVKTGIVDFYPNGGIRPQPGCPVLGLCSHQRSWQFYAESVNNEEAFPAIECTSYLDFVMKKCRGNNIVYFGYSTHDKLSGSYYFKTNKQSPFGKNLSGIFIRELI